MYTYTHDEHSVCIVHYVVLLRRYRKARVFITINIFEK